MCWLCLWIGLVWSSSAVDWCCRASGVVVVEMRFRRCCFQLKTKGWPMVGCFLQFFLTLLYYCSWQGSWERSLKCVLLSVGPVVRQLMYCSQPRLIVLTPLWFPPFISRGAPRQMAWETSISERWNYGREMTDQFSLTLATSTSL
jgi:hypothetical protein